MSDITNEFSELKITGDDCEKIHFFFYTRETAQCSLYFLIKNFKCCCCIIKPKLMKIHKIDPITKDQQSKIQRQDENVSLTCFIVCIHCIKLPHKIRI